MCLLKTYLRSPIALTAPTAPFKNIKTLLRRPRRRQRVYDDDKSVFVLRFWPAEMIA